MVRLSSNKLLNLLEGQYVEKDSLNNTTELDDISRGINRQFGRNGKDFHLARVFTEDRSIMQRTLRLLSTGKKNIVKDKLGGGKLG